MTNVKWIPILSAAFAGWLFSALWHAAAARIQSHAGRRAFPVLALVASLIAQVLMALVLAGVLAHTAKKGVTISSGALVASICWLGFVLTTQVATHVATHARDKIRPLQTLAQSGHWLGVLLVQGIALGALL